jgi:hypothetical protein
LSAETSSPSGSGRPAVGRALGWAVLLAASLLYLRFHFGMLLSRPYGEFQVPEIDLPAPQACAPLGLIVLAAMAGGTLVASRLRGVAPAAVAFALGAYLTLVVPAHVLDAMGWLLRHRSLRPWPWAAAAWLGVGALALWRWLRPPRRAYMPRTVSPHASADPLKPWLLAVALVVAALYAEGVGRTIRHGARAWDAYSYQLLVPIQWVRLESLSEPLVRQVIFGRLGLEKFANPGNANMLMALPLLAGWDLVACLVQLPFAALGAWATFSLARGAGASTAAAGLAALAFASAPVIVNQATVPLTDLASGALSLAAVAILLGTAESARAPTAAITMAGLAFGLGLGTKYTAWSHLPLVLLALGCCRWVRSASGRSLARTLLLFTGAALVPCVFWYARNAILFYGNPVYPLRIRVFGVTLMTGTAAETMSGYWEKRMGMTSRWEWLTFPFRDPAYFEESGFGALFVAFALLGLLAGLADALTLRGDRTLSPRRRLLLLTLLALAVFWFAAARTPRFNLPLLGLLAALAAPAVDGLARGRARHGVGALATALAVLTLLISVRYHGWDFGAPELRSEELLKDFPGSGGFAISPAVDTLRPSVIFNDTEGETTSQIANYYLTGADHRHLVYDHRDFAPSNPAAFVACLRTLGAGYVFLRLPRTVPVPGRYHTPLLEPFLTAEVERYRSTLYRIR